MNPFHLAVLGLNGTRVGWRGGGSPFRVPVARLAAAQAAIEEKLASKKNKKGKK